MAKRKSQLNYMACNSTQVKEPGHIFFNQNIKKS